MAPEMHDFEDCLCDQCGELIKGEGIFNDDEMTQFCSTDCESEWALDDNL